MKNQAFTLIELLVVVLIIGILAAIALPQYQKAVEKSRAAQALVLLKSADSFVRAYYLANGEWPSSFDEAGIEIPWTGTTKWYNVSGDVRSNAEWSIQLENQGLYVSLLLGRLSGPYAGVGFGIQFAHASDSYAPILGKLVCIEPADESGLAQGAYCEKVMNASFLFAQGPFRYFQLTY